jgi:hypothetical protein
MHDKIRCFINVDRLSKMAAVRHLVCFMVTRRRMRRRTTQWKPHVDISIRSRDMVKYTVVINSAGQNPRWPPSAILFLLMAADDPCHDQRFTENRISISQFVPEIWANMLFDKNRLVKIQDGRRPPSCFFWCPQTTLTMPHHSVKTACRYPFAFWRYGHRHNFRKSG